MGAHMFKIFCFLLCGMIFTPCPAGSFPYQPTETIRIMSESATDFNKSQTPDVHTWQVVPDPRQPDGALALSFFSEKSDSRLCRLVLSPSGAILDADIAGINSNMIIRKEDLLLIPGFPAPCDILPFQRMSRENAGDNASVPQLYPIKRSAGAQAFVDTLEIQTEGVPYEIAKANGWIKTTRNVEPAGLLQMLKVVNQRTGEVVSMQLWAADADWWIYEKTLFRQSWRLP